MKEERHIIWTDYGLDYEDWRDDLEADYPDLSEDERISLMYEINGDYLDDERANLNVQLSQPILVVGDLGLWNGRRMGYKEIPSGNIRDCLYGDTDYSTWYASGEDYLEAILVLHKKMGMVRSVDVARHMEVSKPSVCHAVATLRDGGFLTMDEDHFLHLTDVGREVAEQIYEKHRFFTDRLIEAGVDPETAERDACRLEHVISETSFQKLKEAAFSGSREVIPSDES